MNPMKSVVDWVGVPILFAHAPDNRECGWLARVYMVKIGDDWERQYFSYDVTQEDVGWHGAKPPERCPICNRVVNENDFWEANAI